MKKDVHLSRGYEVHMLSPDPRQTAIDIETVERATGLVLVSTYEAEWNVMREAGLPDGAYSGKHLCGIFRLPYNQG